jgi:putative transcriptional regulator|tara:strand:+ start:209 stop:829 length:621 start_codon:yes stop_codon:yes gene_type:complete
MVQRKDTSQTSPVSHYAMPFGDAVSLQGQLLIASPHIVDSRFQRSVIMMCQHDQSSAMGVVINHQSDELDIAQLCETLEMGTPRFHGDQPVHIGGPVDGSRGFVLHSQDHMRPESVAITHEIGLTSSVNILSDITNGIGPVHSIISLGYAGWHAGQLEQELSANIWLNLPASSNLLFDVETEDLWDKAYATLGIDPAHYASATGTA